MCVSVHVHLKTLSLTVVSLEVLCSYCLSVKDLKRGSWHRSDIAQWMPALSQTAEWFSYQQGCVEAAGSAGVFPQNALVCDPPHLDFKRITQLRPTLILLAIIQTAHPTSMRCPHPPRSVCHFNGIPGILPEGLEGVKSLTIQRSSYNIQTSIFYDTSDQQSYT